MRQLEGLSDSQRVAVMANIRANTQNQTSKIRNAIDSQNIGAAQAAINTNAQTGIKEDILENNYRQGFEQRQYQAQGNTDNDINNYYNNLADINKQKYMDVHNLNLMNSSKEDLYFDGQQFRRKTTDSEMHKKALNSATS